ncbi:MAG TPA: hypothetical protein VFJ70_06085 [Burkholderiales bacterium]|nr:hypothetical protein [Burkholderiales bacterium]
MFAAMPGRPRRKKHPQEPVFASPPVWIHAALAAKCFLGKEIPLLISRRREAKRRALLQMLDRLPIRSDARSSRTVVGQPTAAAPLDVPLARPAAGAQQPAVRK